MISLINTKLVLLRHVVLYCVMQNYTIFTVQHNEETLIF